MGHGTQEKRGNGRGKAERRMENRQERRVEEERETEREFVSQVAYITVLRNYYHNG